MGCACFALQTQKFIIIFRAAIDGMRLYMSNQKRFFSGVLLLAFSNLLIKAAGLLFKIPLTGILGEGGMAYFNRAYNIYAWFYMLTTSGLSVAVSMLVSENRARANHKQIKIILRTVLLLFFGIGLLGTLIMVFGADAFATLMGVPTASICIMAIAPSLFFSCMSSALRGYFQGYQIMFPTAVSQIMEACGKLFIGISIAKYTYHTLGLELEQVAAYSLLGIAIGVGSGFLFLSITKFFFNERKYENEYLALKGETNIITGYKKSASRLLKIAIPITINSSVMNLTSLFDTFFMTSRLTEYFTASSQMDYSAAVKKADDVFGNYTSLAVPMFNLPPVLIYSLTYAVVPLVTAALARHEKENAKRYMHSSLKLTSLISMPCAVGLGGLSYPILSMFFKKPLVENGAGMLSALAPSVFFISLLAMTNAMLQASGYEKKPIVSMISGALVKLVMMFLLIPIIGKYGTPVSTFICYFVIVVLNMYFVIKYTGLRVKSIEVFVKPLCASLISGFGALAISYFTRNIIGLKISTLLAIFAAMVLYIVSILILRCLDKEDFILLSKGDKIYNLLKKYGFVK